MKYLRKILKKYTPITYWFARSTEDIKRIIPNPVCVVKRKILQIFVMGPERTSEILLKSTTVQRSGAGGSVFAHVTYLMTIMSVTPHQSKP